MHKRERERKKKTSRLRKAVPKTKQELRLLPSFSPLLLCLNLSEFDGPCKYILAASSKDRLKNVVVSDHIKHK